jgi:carbonic anhydrase
MARHTRAEAPSVVGRHARPHGQIKPEAVIYCADGDVNVHGFSYTPLGGYVPPYDEADAHDHRSVVASVHAFLEYFCFVLGHPREAPREVKKSLQAQGYIADRKELIVTCHDDCGFVNALLEHLGFSGGGQGHHYGTSIPVLVKAVSPVLKKALKAHWAQLPSMDHEERRRLAEEQLARVSLENVLTYPAPKEALTSGILDEVGLYRYYIKGGALVHIKSYGGEDIR